MKRLLLSLACLAALAAVSDAALAAMSIDLGSQYLKVGLVKTGIPMEIVLNKESRRKTPNLLAIRKQERLFADAAAALALKYPKNSYPYLLPLLAKKDSDPAVARYKSAFPFSEFSISEARKTMQFTADGETYEVETLLAMVLWSAKQMTEAYAEQSVKDCVIAIPAFFSQAERRAVAIAADIAGLNLLQLISDGSASALNYGVFRRKEITEKKTSMLIYDMGATKTAATLVEYYVPPEDGDKRKERNPTVATIGYGSDRSLGGLEFTLRMQKHLEDIFRATKKTPTDIATNPRSMAKLHKEAERVKQVLSANTKTFAQIENVHEETDFRAEVNRDTFEGLIKDLEDRIAQPFYDAIQMAGVTVEDVDQFVLMGAGTRVPFVKDVLQKLAEGKEWGKFLNTDEATALGALYQSARLSNSFKVLPFDVKDIVLFPVQVNFESKNAAGELQPTSKVLFPAKSAFPSQKKIITFTSYDDDFDFGISYAGLGHLSQTQQKELSARDIARVSVSGVKEQLKEALTVDGSEFKGFKVHISLDHSGILQLHKVELNAEQPAPPEPELPKPEVVTGTDPEEIAKKLQDILKDIGKKDDSKEEENGEEKQTDEAGEKTEEGKEKVEEGDKHENKTDEEADKSKEEKKAEKKKEAPKPKKIRVKLDTVTKDLDLVMMTSEEIAAAKDLLAKFEKAEKAKHEREEAMNAVESKAYNLHEKLEHGEGVVEFLTQEEKTKLSEEVAAVRTWLDEDAGFDTTTEEFRAKKKQMDDVIVKGNKRLNEYREFPKVEEHMKSLFNHSETFLATAANLTKTDEPESEGIFTAVEIGVLSKKYDEVKKWFDEKKAEMSKQAKTDEPAVTVREVEEKGADLQRELKYLFNKMVSYKPKTKKKEDANKKDNKTATEDKEKTTEEKKEGEEKKIPDDLFADLNENQEDPAEKKARKKEEHDPSEL